MIVRAWAAGLLQVLRAPLLVLAGVLALFLVAAPFAAVLHSELGEALAHQPPIALGSGEIDADWWSEFRAHARGLAATFTPTVIGFAAPLDNMSSVLDRTPRPLILMGPVVLGAIAWAALWAVALGRFNRRRGLSWSESRAAISAHFGRFVLISIAAAVAQLVLYFTIHPLLFQVLAPALTTDATAERTAFVIRVILYAVFWSFVALVSVLADYTRVIDTIDRPANIGRAFSIASRFVRERFVAVASLYVLCGMLFVLIFAGYGVVDTVGGSRVGGWRGVALGQAFIIGRVVVRLLFGASALSLVTRLRGQPSIADRKPGPPAAA